MSCVDHQNSRLSDVFRGHAYAPIPRDGQITLDRFGGIDGCGWGRRLPNVATVAANRARGAISFRLSPHRAEQERVSVSACPASLTPGGPDLPPQVD